MSPPLEDPLSSPCPHCGVILDRHMLLDRTFSNPMPGDLTVCMHCNSILIFAWDLTLRLPTEDEKRVMYRTLDREHSNRNRA